MDLQELKRRLKELQDDYEAKSKDNKVKVEDLRKIVDDMKEIRDKIDVVVEAEDVKRRALPKSEDITPENRANTNNKETRAVNELSNEDLDKEYEGTFLRAFRGRKLSERDYEVYERVVELRDVPSATPYFQTESDEDGGFIVPHSVSTKINEYKRQQEFDLTQLVDVQVTSVLSGEFTYEKLDTITPWENVSQWETIQEVATPQFERKSYKIDDYAGILPLPNTLLQDTDQNLLSYIAKYIAKKSIITRNLKILSVIEETYSTKLPITNTDDLMDVFDLELDQAFSNGAKIVTNQEGYNYLRKLKNHNGENLMQPDATKPTRKAIDGHVVVVLPSRTLKSDGDKAPVYIGEFKEAIRFYDRGVYEVDVTRVGGDSWKRNSTDIRVIDRFDAIALDSEAVVAGEIDVTADPSGN